MKKLFLATTAFLVLAAASAAAADMYARPAYTPGPPPVPVYTWTGMCLGGNVGYSWGQSKFDATLTGVGTLSRSSNLDGAIGGAQFGYNYQFGTWVLGLETDIQASGQSHSETLAGLPLTTVTTDHKLEWFGTARPRLGFLATPNLLLYGTAGAAYGQVKDSATIGVVGVGSATATFRDVKAGWTAGAGIEGAFGGGWSAKVEYLYMDLGKTEMTFATPGLGVLANETRRTTDNVVRVGFNYKWGGY
jgi:outer membrane immunogenic protein